MARRVNDWRRSFLDVSTTAPLISTAIDDIRLALNQSQPLGNERFYAKIEKLTGARREARPRGRPRLQPDASAGTIEGQGELKL